MTTGFLTLPALAVDGALAAAAHWGKSYLGRLVSLPVDGDEVERLAARLARAAHAGDPRPLPVKRIPRAGSGPVVAVDGSNATVLEGAGLSVVALRAATVFTDRQEVVRSPGPLKMELLSHGPESVAAKTRDLLELEAAKAALAGMRPGALLVLDGPLDGRPAGNAAVRELLSIAEAGGVAVAGVSKSSGLTIDGAPAFSLAWATGQASAREKTWAIEVKRGNATFVTFVAKLHGNADRVFRVDCKAPEAETVLAHLSGCARDPAYLGYPYPLALAHNSCLITEELCDDLRSRLRTAAEKEGLEGRVWNLLFEDYHDILELGA